MANLTIPLALCFIFTIVSSTPSFPPIDHYLINCGATGSTVDLDHRIFTGDINSNSPLLSPAGSLALAFPNPNSGLSPIYGTGRVFTRPSKYTFKIRDPGAHLIRLHCDLSYPYAEFYVLANGFLLMNSSSIEMNWDLDNFVVIKDYVIRVDSDELVISFVPVMKSKYGIVNAIEVISAPKDLVADVAMYLSAEKNEQISGLLKNGYETVYRVNVGGPKVTPFNDSLWRTWVPDDEFLKSSDGSSKVYYVGRIQYQIGGASREVGPDNMYNTARVIKSLDDSIPNRNITWVFPVEDGYKYLVRLHFCDIASPSRGLLNFNVYVNGYLAYENLDLTMVTNEMLGSPFYADFVVDGGISGNLTVSVGPSKLSMTRAVDAILNGVEIMKMNNSMGSFDGEVCAHYVWKNWRRTGNLGVTLPLLAAVFLLLTATVIVKKSSGFRDSVAWSRLPMDISDALSKHSYQLSSSKV